MKPVLGVAVPVLVLVLSACGQVGGLLPDGGRVQLDCQHDNTVIAVRTVDLMGQPIADAQVVATNPSKPDAPVVATTDGNGLTTAITAEIGSGNITINATAGALKADTFIVAVTCGNCGCTSSPGNATLILK